MLTSLAGEGPAMTLIPAGGGFLDAAAEPAELPPWLTQQDIDAYVAPVRGVRLHRAAELVPQHGPQLGADGRLAARADRRSRRCSWPVTAIRSSASSSADGLGDVLPKLTRSVILPGCGHWTQQERPAEVSDAMIAFLRELG